MRECLIVALFGLPALLSGCGASCGLLPSQSDPEVLVASSSQEDVRVSSVAPRHLYDIIPNLKPGKAGRDDNRYVLGMELRVENGLEQPVSVAASNIAISIDDISVVPECQSTKRYIKGYWAEVTSEYDTFGVTPVERWVIGVPLGILMSPFIIRNVHNGTSCICERMYPFGEIPPYETRRGFVYFDVDEVVFDRLLEDPGSSSVTLAVQSVMGPLVYKLKWKSPEPDASTQGEPADAD